MTESMPEYLSQMATVVIVAVRAEVLLQATRSYFHLDTLMFRDNHTYAGFDYPPNYFSCLPLLPRRLQTLEHVIHLNISQDICVHSRIQSPERILYVGFREDIWTECLGHQYPDAELVVADAIHRRTVQLGKFDLVYYRGMGGVRFPCMLDIMLKMLGHGGMLDICAFSFIKTVGKPIPPDNAWHFWIPMLNHAQEFARSNIDYETQLHRAGFMPFVQMQDLPLGGYNFVGDGLMGITVEKIKGVCARILEYIGVQEDTAREWIGRLEDRLWTDSRQICLSIERILVVAKASSQGIN